MRVWGSKTITPPVSSTPTETSQFRNWPSMYTAWLQGTITNGASSSAGRTLIAQCDIAITQNGGSSNWTNEYNNALAIQAIRSGIMLGPYGDPCMWYADSEVDPAHFQRWVYTAISTGPNTSIGSQNKWRLRDSSGTGLVHRFDTTNSRAVNMASQLAGLNGSGRSVTEELALSFYNTMSSPNRYGISRIVAFDDMTCVDYPKYVGGSDASPDYDQDGTPDSTTDNTVPTGGGYKYRNGQVAMAAALRAQFGANYALWWNNDLAFPYISSPTPPRPVNTIEVYQLVDALLHENTFYYRYRIGGAGGTGGHVYNISAANEADALYYDSEGDVAYAVNEICSMTDAQSKFGRMCYATYVQMELAWNDPTQSTDLQMARLVHARNMSCTGAAYCCVYSGANRPFWLDELAIDFGNPRGTRTMGTLNQGSAPCTFTRRTPDVTGGSGEKFYFTEYDNALVVMRWDRVGLTLPSTLGSGTAVSVTLPSAGSGYRWDRFDANTYVNPKPGCSDLRMTGQNTTYNSGATNVTSVSLLPLDAIFLRRVAI